VIWDLILAVALLAVFVSALACIPPEMLMR